MDYNDAKKTFLTFGEFDRLKVNCVEEISRFRDLSELGKNWLGNRQSLLFYSLETEPAYCYYEKEGKFGFYSEEEKDFDDHLFIGLTEFPLKNNIRTSKLDYEKLVIKTPGLRIWDCKVLDLANFSDEYYKNEVHIAVRPYSENGYAILSEAYQKNILNQIMDKRLIGSFVKLYSPIYIEVSDYAELRVNPQYIYAEKKVESVVKKFFLKLNGFGPIINYGALFASIDSLEEVMEVCMLYIDARGGGISRNRNGDVLLPPLGVLLLKNVDCIVIR